MVRYSLLRALMFFFFLSFFWLLSLRGLWLVLAAALTSMVVSFWVLRRFRMEFSAQLARRVDARAARAVAAANVRDEDVEDGAVDEAFGQRAMPGDAAMDAAERPSD